MKPMRQFLLIAFVSLGCLFRTAPIHAQTADEVEKSIANLPSAQRAWERFRFWIGRLPPEQHQPDKVQALYRAYLKSRGFSETEIGAQLKFVDEEGARSEVERWNRILTAEKPRFNTKPNAFLVEMVKNRKPGTALDVGMGQGRNSIWLAQQGWEVTGFDPAEKAVALARETAGKLGVNLKTEIKRTEDFDFGQSRWDLILLSYVGGRGFTGVVQKALKPGGVLVIEGFHRDATKEGPIGEGVVFDTGELPPLFPQLRVVRYEEPVADADFGQIKVRLVRYCAERPE
jgi:SAM-dependent methyltransferase